MFGLLGEELMFCFLVWLLICVFNEVLIVMVLVKLVLFVVIVSVR